MHFQRLTLIFFFVLGDSVSLVIGTNNDKFTVENLSVDIEIVWDISRQRALLEANNQRVNIFAQTFY